jgi:hypothetical protein
MSSRMSTQIARTLLFVVIIAVVTALLDSLLYWATKNGTLTLLLWVAWQSVTLVVLVGTVPPIFEEVQSAFVRRTAVASLVIVLHAIVTILGVVLMGNVRELFGVPI